jgi:hypothetical protein
MIVQAHRDSQKSSRKFLLIIGQNRQEPVAITNQIDLPVKGWMFKGYIDDLELAMFRMCDLLCIEDSHFFFDNP